MSVLVRFGDSKAILRSGQWRSSNLALERRLNDATDAWIQETGGPRLEDLHQERSVAEEMARRFQGRLGQYLRSRTGHSADSFFEKRQMHLDF